MANRFLSHNQRWLRIRRHSMFARNIPHDVTASYHDYDAASGDVTADYGIPHYPDYYYVDYAAADREPPNDTYRCFPDDVTPAGIPCNSTWVDSAASFDGTGSNWWALILIVFPALTVFGNVLVVMSVYREKTLQSVTNYFIVSLAVADIMVAVLVMPLAVYVEVNGGEWELGDIMCDTWVALDVMCCTASILNLAAIGVDRFYAVTRPIKYSKHKNSNRVYITLALTWIISVGISSPIALGMNYTDRRAMTPKLCTFYNSDFLIYSSMASFYIPCIVMTLLYWRIFHAIRQRARKSAAASALSRQHRTAKTSPPSAAVSGAPGSLPPAERSAAGTAERGSLLPPPPPVSSNCVRLAVHELSSTEDHALRQNLLPPVKETALNQEEMCDGDIYCGATADETDFEQHGGPIEVNVWEPDHAGAVGGSRSVGTYLAPSTVVVERKMDNVVSASVPTTFNAVPLTSAPPSPEPAARNTQRKPAAAQRNGGHRGVEAEQPKRFVTRFNFGLRRVRSAARRRKKSSDQPRIGGAHNAQKRERKATKTLAIVLGVFLLCWVPFFTINIVNAVCIRYDHKHAVCQIDPMLFSFFVWLGYMNSFLNPVIYTIFNMEFRRAFKKILLDPCSCR